jgi:D-xylose transport system ATP-binding protein
MPLLEMREIVKDFVGVRALDGVSLTLEAGEFHSLVGENGAGKSTLMKVLSGVYPDGTFSGEILVEGEAKTFRNVRDSELAGMAIIFQELSLVKELTVGENIFLGREPERLGVINWSELYHRASELLRQLNLRIDPRVKVGDLGIGQQQLVEIAKALSLNARILVLDEPTAALTESEVEVLFGILGRLRERGVGMIYISHKLDEVFRLSDRITVLRDGRSVATYRTRETTKNSVIAAMVGRDVEDVFPEPHHRFGDVALRVTNVTAYSLDQSDRKVVNGVSFEVRKGEVLGIAGLMGSGRTELLMSVFAAWHGRYSREVQLNGRSVEINSPADAIRHGIGFVTEDRKRFGLVLDQTIRNNVTLARSSAISTRFIIDERADTAAADRAISSLRIKARSPLTVVGTLSGGNQQKVVLGKWLFTEPTVLFLDEPTRGIDIGAKQEIYSQINKLAQEGLAIVLVSSELPEILGLSDRIMVMHEGRVTGEFTRAEATPEKVMHAATG